MVSAATELNTDRPKRSALKRSFLWCRRSVFLFFLLLAYGAVHLNQIGIPEFLKRPLLDQLRARGLELDFTRLRVRLGRGLVADHVSFKRTGELAGELLYAEDVQLKLDWSSLVRFSAPQILGLKLRNGLVQIPIPATADLPSYNFKISEVSGLLVFLGSENWELRSLEASSHGSQFRASGSITNASVLRKSKPPPPKPGSLAWKKQLRRIGQLLDQATFSSPPILSVAFHADLRAPLRSTADVQLKGGSAQMLDGSLRDFTATLQFNQPPSTNVDLPLSLRIEAHHGSNHWGAVSNLILDASANLSSSNVWPSDLTWRLRLDSLNLPRITTGALVAQGVSLPTNTGLDSRITLAAPDFRVHWSNATVSAGYTAIDLQAFHTLTNCSRGSIRFSSTDAVSPWLKTQQISTLVDLQFETNSTLNSPADGFWRFLQPFSLAASLTLSNAVAQVTKSKVEIPAHRLSSRITWSPRAGGVLSLTNVSLSTPSGFVNLSGSLNSQSRRVAADFDAQLDLLAYLPLLTPAAQHWISQYGWQSNGPPVLAGQVGAILPAWTNRSPDWRGEVVPTLHLSGLVSGSNFTFRGIQGSTASGGFSYTNRTWRIPSMTATRPEGTLQFSYEGNDITKAYHFRLLSTLDPKIVQPLLQQEGARRALSELSLGSPPKLEGEVWGFWKDRDRTGFDVHLSATNLVFRGETIEALTGRVLFTNALLAVRDVTLRSQGYAEIPSAAFDIPHKWLSFTNTRTLLDPLRVASVIGPKSARVMSNYLFAVRPETTFTGVIGFGTNVAATDIRFSAVAPAFRWWHLDLAEAIAQLHFKGETLALTGLRSAFHGGSAAADLYFDWSQKAPGTLVSGDVAVTNLVLASLLQAVGSRSNRIEGILTGRASFSGQSSDTNSWGGRGRVSMKDGFLWDFPVFGIFSMLFDALSPGLGQARFTEGKMTLAVTNSILYSRDLTVRSPAMRLSYRGSVDLASRLNARMEAELFRDTPVIGPLFSLLLTPVTKLFIYDVKGTLKKPLAEPRYIPKVLLMLLRPIKTLRDLLPKEESPGGSTAPPL